MSPIKLRFDGVNNVDGENIVHFPKLSQGAPYSFGFRIRLHAIYRQAEAPTSAAEGDVWYDTDASDALFQWTDGAWVAVAPEDVEDVEDTLYRDWDDVVGIRWRIKLRPGDKHELMTLTKAAGNFLVDSASDTLTFVVKASDWTGVVLPQSNNVLEMDVPFAFVVEFLDAGGIVTERFAQGSGFITVNLDF
jgi:hypothetical protein